MTLSIDETTAEDQESDEVEAESQQHQARFLVIALLVTTAVWVPLFVASVQAHQANVDDFLYAGVARGLVWQGNVGAILHTGQTSPLVPLLAGPGADLGGIYGAMTVELPFLLLLVAGSYALARLWLSPPAAMVAALAVALNEDVSGYAVMLHFAVPTAAALVWAFYAHARSRHFRNWMWSVVFGVAVAAMLLSRSMAVVYAVAVAAVVGIDLLVDMAKRGGVLRLPVLLALVTTLALAGPWWLVSGHAALHYLQSAGYQPSTGYASRGAALGATTIVQRAKWTLVELGWGQSWVLAIALLAALWLAVRHRHTLKLTYLWVLALWALLTSLILSTSSNQGTGYGLPVIVILIVLAAAVLGQMSWRVLPFMTVVVAGILAVGLVAEVADQTGTWWPAAPYRGEVYASGGTTRTNVDLLAAQVTRIIGSAPTLLAQQSDILNANGLTWNAGAHPQTLLMPPKSAAGTRVATRQLTRATLAITGSTVASYYPLVNQGAVESSALRDGFHAIRVWLVGPGQSFILWQRGTTAPSPSVPIPATRVLRPSAGADVKGTVLLVASGSDRAFATKRVEFTISSSATARSITVPTQLADYVWLAKLDTTTLADGTYSVQSTAVDAVGDVGRSKPVTIHVDN